MYKKAEKIKHEKSRSIRFRISEPFYRTGILHNPSLHIVLCPIIYLFIYFLSFLSKTRDYLINCTKHCVQKDGQKIVLLLTRGALHRFKLDSTKNMQHTLPVNKTKWCAFEVVIFNCHFNFWKRKYTESLSQCPTLYPNCSP